MRILLVLCRPLFPADTGGRIRTLNTFSRLAKSAEVCAVSLAVADRDGEAILKMKQVFPDYTPVFWKETTTFSPAFYAELLQSQFSRFPYALAKYRNRPFRETVQQVFRRKRPDVVVADGLSAAAAVLETPLRPFVVFERNVEFQIRKRHWETTRNPLHRFVLGSEYRKTRALEAEICQTADHIIAVSEEDRRSFQEDLRVINVSAIPTGVDLDYFRPHQPAQQAATRPGNLVFVGSMDWYPNEDGILWFAEHVYPRIRQAAPMSNLTVVGRNPSPRLRKLAAQDASIEITGTVPDVRPYLQRAEAVVVPLRIGGGTRIKIFEAMAMGRAVVSTHIGAEGLPVTSGSDILLADEPGTLADAVVSLLVQPALRERIGLAARAKVARDHSWERVAARTMEILEGVVHGTHPAATAERALVTK